MSYGELLSMCGIEMLLHAEFRGAQYERVGQISAFRREVDENCILLGCYAVSLFDFLRDNPPVGQGLLIHVSRSHTTTHHSR